MLRVVLVACTAGCLTVAQVTSTADSSRYLGGGDELAWRVQTLGAPVLGGRVLWSQPQSMEKHAKSQPRPRMHFATLAVEGFEEAAGELCGEANRTGIFAELHCLKTIPSQAMTGRWNSIQREQGVSVEWLWKPAVVQHLLRQIPQGDVLFFAEPGVELVQNLTTWRGVWKLLTGAGPHVVAFQRSGGHEYESTRGTVFREFGLSPNSREASSYQVSSAYFFIRNSRPAHLFVNSWESLMADPVLLADRPSRVHDHQLFTEHKHEESLWSMMIKANRGASAVPSRYRFPDFKVMLLQYRGCDDPRRADAWPVTARCARHKQGLTKKAEIMSSMQWQRASEKSRGFSRTSSWSRTVTLCVCLRIIAAL